MSYWPTFSEFLGYASITAWLGAQFPQVVENYHRQSCEGLALPFLANWLLGDFSNLVGCLLTHQLPFQTYLATYFVFIDLALVAQYFYYGGDPKPALTGKHVRAASRRLSIDRAASRYRTLSAAAANVATTAALVAEYDEHLERRRLRHGWPRGSIEGGRRSGDVTNQPRNTEGDDEDEVDEHAWAALADSFHSEGGRDPGSARHEYYNRRAGSLGPSGVMRPGRIRHATVPTFTSTDSLSVGASVLGRGRSVTGTDAEDVEAGVRTSHHERRSSRASKRGATMVFLGVWATFGIGSLTQTQREASGNAISRTGEVLSMPPKPAVPYTPDQLPEIASSIIDSPSYVHASFHQPSTPESDTPLPVPPPAAPPDTERILGRFFAWLCTTLYLTSRLPQIWKNYTRKSVEGLSMYLFVFAFTGNVFYVSSILSSPQMRDSPDRTSAFLKESIPYLLGSGGTLMFDITIVGQSFIYKPKAKRRASVHIQPPTEQTNLLSDDALAHTYSVDSNVVSRGRTMQGGAEDRIEP